MKPVLMFVLGAVLASGVVMLMMKSDRTPAAAPVAAVQQPAAEPAAEPPAPAPLPVAAPVVEPVAPSKPSPVIRKQAAPVRRPEPVTTAKNTISQPAPPAASPAPAPVPVEQTPAAPAPVIQPPPPAPVVEEKKPEPRIPQTVTIPAGTLLSVRLDEELTTEKNDAGDAFRASLEQALVVNGFVIAERGARVTGKITELDKGGRVSGLARMSLAVTQITSSDGQKIQVNTETFSRQAQSSRGRDAAKVGAAAGIGAAIGAIAGGGKGAAIGAVVGGATGTGGVMATRGSAAELPVETRLSFRLSQPVTVTEQLR